MQRGFKTWCENISLQFRRDLDLHPIDPLDPRELAEYLAVEVWTPDDVPGLDKTTLDVLLKKDSDSWSAVTLSVDSKDLVILNSSHSGGRPASNLAHELAHIIIGHVPARIDVSDTGLLLSAYNRPQEDEAAWLAGCLLLPRPACLHILNQGINMRKAADSYGISPHMVRFRINVTGAQRQAR